MLMLGVTAEGHAQPGGGQTAQRCGSAAVSATCATICSGCISFQRGRDRRARVEFIAVMSEGTGLRILTTQKPMRPAARSVSMAISHLLRNSPNLP